MSASVMQDFYAPSGSASATPREKLAAAVDWVARTSRGEPFQPWQFLVTASQVELYADFDQASEPEGREVIIHCGAALFHLRLALKRSGALGKVELFPLLGQPNLLARVHYGPSGAADPEANALFAAMTGRNVEPPSSTLAIVPELVLEELAATAMREHAALETLQSESSRQRLLNCVHESERFRDTTGNTSRPFALRLRMGSDDASQEEPIDSFMLGRTGQSRSPLFARMVRALDFGRRETVRGRAPMATPMLAVLKTKSDNNPAWLAAGQAMARVLLTAQARGVSTACLNQAVQGRATREMLRTSIGRKGYPQMILRFGFPLPESNYAISSGLPLAGRTR